MPVVLPPSKVLVTGASGFSGIWVVKTLLEKGYTVRGSVRSEAKGKYLEEYFQQHAGMFEFVVVRDVGARGTLDEALEGDIEAVVHVTGESDFTLKEVQFIGPNTGGTVNMLDSLLTHGRNDDWNDTAVAAVEKDVSQVEKSQQYGASKALAERAILEFVEKHREEIGWDVVCFLPSWCWGPVIHQVLLVRKIRVAQPLSQIVLLYDMLTTPRAKGTTDDYAVDWIDVRDVAAAVSVALASDKAAGERFILNTESATYQNIYDSVHTDPTIRSTLSSIELIQTGEPIKPPHILDFPFAISAKAQQVLGLNTSYPLGQSVADTWRTICENGKLPAAKLQKSVATFGLGISEEDKEGEASSA
ncbi:hypothetical protein EVG20_g6944 [Dentipellis fragilis]|uniref:NAD-dependent epimerase/dehydratase domain-containing protein n=1 Tax=Dentipellis fragilis TaxID=205917 RepID=A0A4Y9YGR3_9AGAM|nr:hypothetical protein EVG20_g6944 [Dentipellis fragilis]